MVIQWSWAEGTQFSQKGDWLNSSEEYAHEKIQSLVLLKKMLRLDIVYTMHVITKNITIEKKIETRKKKAVEERAQLKLQKN